MAEVSGESAPQMSSLEDNNECALDCPTKVQERKASEFPGSEVAPTPFGISTPPAAQAPSLQPSVVNGTACLPSVPNPSVGLSTRPLDPNCVASSSAAPTVAPTPNTRSNQAESATLNNLVQKTSHTTQYLYASGTASLPFLQPRIAALQPAHATTMAGTRAGKGVGRVGASVWAPHVYPTPDTRHSAYVESSASETGVAQLTGRIRDAVEPGKRFSYEWLYCGPSGWPYKTPPSTTRSPPHIGVREPIQRSTYPFGRGNAWQASQPPTAPLVTSGAAVAVAGGITRTRALPAASLPAPPLVVTPLPLRPVFAPGTPNAPPELCNNLSPLSPPLQAVVKDGKWAARSTVVREGLAMSESGVSRSLSEERLRTDGGQIVGGNRRRLQKRKNSIAGPFRNLEVALGGKRVRNELNTYEDWIPPEGITRSQVDVYGRDIDVDIYSKRRRVAETPTSSTYERDTSMEPELTGVHRSSKGSARPTTSPALFDLFESSTTLPLAMKSAATVGECMISSPEYLMRKCGTESHGAGGDSTAEGSTISTVTADIEVPLSIDEIQWKFLPAKVCDQEENWAKGANERRCTGNSGVLDTIC